MTLSALSGDALAVGRPDSAPIKVRALPRRSHVALTETAMAGAVAPPAARRRLLRALRRHSAWLLLAGWIVLPLLPVFGLGLSVMLGVGLF